MYPANTVNARNVYPTYQGMPSLGDFASSPLMAVEDTTIEGNDSKTSAVDKAVAVGMAGEPIKWWLSILALLLILMYVAQKFDGGEGNYSNLRMSAYNIVVVTLSAIVGLSIFKVLFTKFPVPGLSTVILAA